MIVSPPLTPSQVDCLIQRLEAAWETPDGCGLTVTTQQFNAALWALFPEHYADRNGAVQAMTRKLRERTCAARPMPNGYRPAHPCG